MANVLFKRGLHSALPTGSNIKDGVFYLTTDTNRLFIGQQLQTTDTPVLVELNKSITVVSNANQLPTTTSTTTTEVKGNQVAVGQFYYVNAGANSVSGNILAVCADINSTTGAITWVQVNPDTNTNDHLSDVTIGSDTVSNGVISIPFTFSMVDKNGAALTPIQKTLTFAASDVINLIDADVSASVSNNVATVTTKIKNTNANTTSTGDSFALKAGSGVTITQDANNNIEIAASVTAGAIALDVTSATNEVDAVVKVNGQASGDTLKLAGEKGIEVTYDATNDIAKFGHTNTASNGTAGGATETATTLANGGNFTAVIESKYDDYGHVTSQKKQTITLPTISAGSIGVDSTDKSKLTFTVKDQNGTASAAATSGSVLYHTITVWDSPNPQTTPTATTKKNQSDLGTFYSKAAIDEMMKGLDALTYKGTVAQTSDIPTSNVSIGDTYKVSGTSVTASGNTAKTGDLIIATGTEGSDGYITSNTLTWTVVASGAETDTTYQTKVTAGSNDNVANVGILASTAGGNFTQYTEFSSDGVVTLTPTAGVDGAGRVALGHKNSGATAGNYAQNTAGAVSAGGSIVVPKLSVDAQGHVTSIADVSLSIPGDPKLGTDTTNKKVALQNNGGTNLGTIEFKNGNLTTVTVGGSGVNPTVTYNHATPTMGSDTAPTGAVTLSSSTNTDRQITAISGITRDSYGHVIAIATKTYTLGQINDSLDHSITSTAVSSSSSGTATVTTTLKDYAGSSKGASAFTLQSSGQTIEITNPSSDNINIDIVWGSF